MAAVTINDVRKYFEFQTAANFAAEWRKLTDKDKAEIKKGLEDGTLTY